MFYEFSIAGLSVFRDAVVVFFAQHTSQWLPVITCHHYGGHVMFSHYMEHRKCIRPEEQF